MKPGYGMHYAFFGRGTDCPLSGNTMKKLSLLLASLLLTAGACSTFRHNTDINAQTGPTALVVDNQGFIDMSIYAVRSSQRIRLGTATGAHKTTLTIPPSLVSGINTLRFIADPIGGTRASVSEEITVVPGDTVGLMIPPV
jgi:hypothetical protein